MALFLEFAQQQWMPISALLVVLLLLFLHETRKAGPSVSPQQAIKLINGESGVFLDIRDQSEFKQGHIPDAINIPNTKLTDRMAELEKHRSAPIVVVCKMGQTAASAAKQLMNKDYNNVYRMSGGMMEWDNLQLPTVKK